MNKSAHPTPEALAAFVDGRLPDEERRAIVAHLDACPDCYEVFAETVRFLGEEEPRGQVLRPPQLAAKRWLGWAAAAAAVVAVAVVVPMLRMEPGREGMATLPGEGELEVSAGALVAAIEVPEGVGVAGVLWEGWRGGELGFGGAGLTEEAVAFRTGVGFVDLRAAVEGREPDVTIEVLARCGRGLELAGVEADLAATLEEARDAAERGRFKALRTAITEVEVGAEELLDPFHLAFGKWAEAGRLAAAIGDRGFFRSPQFVGFRQELDAGGLPATVGEVLVEIDTVMQGDMGSPQTMVELEQAFHRLIGRSGGTT